LEGPIAHYAFSSLTKKPLNSGVWAFGSVTVGVSEFGERAGRSSSVLLNASVPIMNGNADLIDLLAVDGHGLDAMRDHRFGMIAGTSAGDLHFVAAFDAEIGRQLHGDFDERFGHQLHVHRIVLGPVMIMLGEAIGGADDGEPVRGRAVFIQRCLEALGHGIFRTLGMQSVVDRAFGGFVEFRKWSVGEGSQRREDAADAFRVHNETDPCDL